MSLVALIGASLVLRDTFIEFIGSGYRQKLVEFPVFGLCLLKRCL